MLVDSLGLTAIGEKLNADFSPTVSVANVWIRFEMARWLPAYLDCFRTDEHETRPCSFAEAS